MNIGNNACWEITITLLQDVHVHLLFLPVKEIIIFVWLSFYHHTEIWESVFSPPNGG